ncbi:MULTISPECIES: FAD assembly factor SdhE [Undibacterium]|jgi:antitoxin CptB|uniref:FAD assembly factor SdhE n=1 Tax=Undibacterium umbellatum TaxID=2762300 RepID=A0ABR6Z3P8_9BURK|nr:MULTISPECIES: succinate dehydrogenase assembly factor 2 [Undibacterium]MBC3906350.1 succinate dehydrogenase assembly factor 2 [Undibacterium umbellatum]MDP1977913.1 succinate dehydrogenase assembly factor 2 [Undibacterium sp.]
MSESQAISHQNDPVKRARLRWRARRGLLENDLILTRFLDANEESLTDEEVDAFSRLMELPDNTLMDLIMAKKQAEAEVDLPHVHALLLRLQTA